MPRFLVWETGANTVIFWVRECSRHASKDSRKGDHFAELDSKVFLAKVDSFSNFFVRGPPRLPGSPAEFHGYFWPVSWGLSLQEIV